MRLTSQNLSLRFHEQETDRQHRGFFEGPRRLEIPTLARIFHHPCVPSILNEPPLFLPLSIQPAHYRHSRSTTANNLPLSSVVFLFLLVWYITAITNDNSSSNNIHE